MTRRTERIRTMERIRSHHVARLLNRLPIGELTKSRPRHSNDNALVESKKRNHRPQVARTHPHPRRARPGSQRLPPRPTLPPPQLPPPLPLPLRCRRTARTHQEGATAGGTSPPPMRRFKSLDDAECFLRDGVTFEQRDKITRAASGLEATRRRWSGRGLRSSDVLPLQTSRNNLLRRDRDAARHRFRGPNLRKRWLGQEARPTP